MKRFKAIISLVLIASTMILTSCLKETDPSENTYSVTTYCTIRGSYPNYRFYCDDGGIIIPSVESVAAINKSGSFGKQERAMISFTYKTKNVTKDELTKEDLVNDATLNYAMFFDTDEIIEKTEAEEKHITDKDSCAIVNKFVNAWVSRGFLTVIIQNAYYRDANGKVLDGDLNLVYDKEKIAENKFNLTLCYNDHKTKESTYVGTTAIVRTFSIDQLRALVPGTEKIALTITPANGGETLSFNVNRSTLVKP